MTELIPLFGYLERLNALKFSVRDLESAGIFETTPGGDDGGTLLKVVRRNTRKSNPKENIMKE